MTGPRWQGNCYGCKRESEVQSREHHAMQVLCDACASRPHRKPTAAGLDVMVPEVAAPPKDIAQTNGDKPTAGKDRYAGRILDVAAMLAAAREPIPWRCEKFAADGYLTVLAGRGKEGKTWLAMALACGVALGRAAAGIPCAKGRAILFDAENGPRLIKDRFHAIGVTADMHVQPVDCGGLRIVRDLPWFRKVIEDRRANLVVFDSLRVLSSGAKENDGDDMEPIITALKQLARETGAAIILIHHRGKSETNEYRGTSVILDQTDMLFRLGRVHPDGKHRRKVETVGCRVAEEPDPRWVSIEPEHSRNLVFVSEADPYEGEDERERPRDALRDHVLEVLGGIPRSARSIARAVGRKPNDGTIGRLLDDLRTEGLAEKHPDGWVRHAASPMGVAHVAHPPKSAP
jgi:AAA domain-containing protein